MNNNFTVEVHTIITMRTSLALLWIASLTLAVSSRENGGRRRPLRTRKQSLEKILQQQIPFEEDGDEHAR